MAHLCFMDIANFYRRFIQCGKKFTTDSRKAGEARIFFALKGANFDGNEYAAGALEAGCELAVVDDEKVATDERFVLVDDVLSFMQELATFHRRQLNIPVIAVAGSNGKTTTKELLGAVLECAYRVHITQGNFNNLIGTPITLLEMPLDTECAVIEIGTNQFGEIKRLCEIVEPTHGIITNIGKEHLEGFGDIEGVIREESELYLYLQEHQGRAYVNGDDSILINMARRLQRVKTYGLGPDGDVTGTIRQRFPGLEVEVNDVVLKSNLSGDYNAENILAAAAIGLDIGLNINQIARGVSNYTPSNNRSQYIETERNHVIMDAYNANPTSMAKALESFRNIDSSKKLLLLGDMLEMGDHAAAEHRDIADLALAMPDAKCVFIGEDFHKLNSYLNLSSYPDVDAFLADYPLADIKEHWILIKGSRGVRMEKILDSL